MDTIITHGLEAINTTIAIIFLWIICRVGLRIDLRLQRFALVACAIATVLYILRELVYLGLGDYSFIIPLYNNNLLQAATRTAMLLFLGCALFFTIVSHQREIKTLQYAADTEPLTNLHNQAYFRRVAVREMKAARELRHPLSLLILDLDDFKAYNDGFGHEAGNQALQVVADILRSLVPTGGLIARYGGEEFVVLLPGCNILGLVVAESIRAGIEAQTTPERNPRMYRQITVSIGLTLYTPNMKRLEDFIQSADQELYRAKVSKNSVRATIQQLDND